MSKLNKLKKWYTLAEAAKRLTSSFEQEVTLRDVVQFIVEGQMFPYWELINEKLLPINKIREVPRGVGRYVVEWNDEDVEIKSGIYKIVLEPGDMSRLTSSLRRFLYEGKWYEGHDPTDCKATVLEGDDGQTYYMLREDPFLAEQFQKDVFSRYNELLAEGRYDGDRGALINAVFSDPEIRNRSTLMFTCDIPSLTEIIITREELYRFESQGEDQEKPLGTREKDTLYKIIIGMATAAYRYDAAARRSDAIPEIVSDLEMAGVPVSIDTVRTHIKNAAQLLPSKPI